MRPLRFLLSLASCIVAFFLLLFIGPWRESAQQDAEKQSSIKSYFNWRTPSSLFPPSAVISLTDDNSTIFMARPAAFGPLLPARSMSGELWIGSGFGEDRLGRSGAAEGELGCSDVPGWSDKTYVSAPQSLSEAKNSWSSAQDSKSQNLRRRASDVDETEEDTADTVEWTELDDGTDDYLHHPLPASDGLKSSGHSTAVTQKPTHADIQSLQESAEIAGKIVLLSRGGCGFAEKVKWAQRRGGIALIVGDDVRSAPLVTMYARGDTSNVTIPSLFVSHTTAHLLSGLIPSGRRLSGLSVDDAERLGLAFGDKSGLSKGGSGSAAVEDKPDFTSTVVGASSSATPETELANHHGIYVASPGEPNLHRSERGWLRSFFGRRRASQEDFHAPQNDGQVGWVLQSEFDDEDDDSYRGSGDRPTTTSSSAAPSKTPNNSPGDGFVIGIQDWRDPDLVAYQKEQRLASSMSSVSTNEAESTSVPLLNGLKGGSITPGSGEYAKGGIDGVGSSKAPASGESDASQQDSSGPAGSWLGRLFTSDEYHGSDPSSDRARTKPADTRSSTAKQRNSKATEGTPEQHEGLWVTLTPTSMSSSPFFDTLLVLVVSPLVTLTVVYALLLLRSRIRRRRWRAPKSVVERLPVRTYQTMPSTTTTTSSTSSSISSPITSTTPLLPSSARPINAKPRPRSRTTSGVTHQQSSSLPSIASPSPDQIEEKRAAGLSEWKKRYGGKQRECVVCLEEYVDGVSRVMSLPCGHEFHAECITPWLTTRRRTCPICKGDVVRSLARNNGSNSSSPPQTSDPDEEDSDDVQEQAVLARNDDPVAHQPVTREDEAFEDLEQGMGPDRTR